MKRMILIAVSAAILSAPVAFAQKTTKLTAAKHNEYGLIYSLPITHVDIVISATKTVKTAGPFYQYAKKYLGVDNAITADSQEWTIDNVNVYPYGVPDKKEEYLMQFKSGSSPFLILNDKGLPMSINIEKEEVPVTIPVPAAPTKSILDNGEYSKSLPGELLVSESTAKKAELAANMIYKIRESRTNYATGEADQMPPDGAAMKLVLEQLDTQEAALTALFLGTSKTEGIIKHIDYVPAEESKNEILCRVSDFFGIVDKNDLSGEPVYLSLKITQRGELPVNEKGEEKRIPKGAVMYKIPGEAQLTITYDDRKIYDEKIQVAQYGMDFGLDPEMFTDKKNPSYVIFNPNTGSVKEIGNVNAN